MPRRLVLNVAASLMVGLMVAGCGSLGFDAGSAGESVARLPESEDADQDGVADAEDACPDTTFTVGLSVDGCSPFFGTVDGVEFTPGGAQLDRKSRKAVDPLVAALLAHPEVRIEIQGHTDNRGPADGNLELSKRRVMSVVRYVVTSGVAPDRVDPVAYGESRPVAKNATPEGRSSNRRIEVRAVAP